MKPTVTVTILDEVNCTVHGLSDDHLHHFCNVFAVFADNHFFNPKFKIGAWDGKIRYFHANGTTYVHLLDDMFPTMIKLGYSIKIDDKRTATIKEPKLIDKDMFSFIELDEGEKLELYEHQTRVANTLINNGGGVAVAATGAGKSYICAAIAQVYNDVNARVLVIVPSQDLVLQTREDFLSCRIDCGEYSGDVKDYKHSMTVMSTWQALQNNPTVVKDFDVVIVDECHGIKGQVLQKLLNDYGHKIAHRYGVTGTLPKSKTDAMAVRITVGSKQCEVTAKELIDVGILASLDIHIEQIDEDLQAKYDKFLEEVVGKKPTYKQFKASYFPDYSAEKTFLQRNTERLEYIKSKLQTLKDNGNTFVLVDGVAFGKRLAKDIPGAVFVHGTDKKAVRKQIYELFKSHDNLLVIATVNIASTGLNIKRIYNLVLIDIGKSFTRVIQSIGRGLRVAKDKDHVDVFDICSDLKYGKKHLAQRVVYYNEAEYPHNKRIIQLNTSTDVDL